MKNDPTLLGRWTHRFWRQVTIALILVAGFTVPAQAQEPLHQKIDKLIATGVKDYEKNAAPIADDAEFLRRIYLDLTGRIPTPNQARAFFNDSRANKRAQLVDALLAGPEHARHMMNYFNVLWMERRAVRGNSWPEFLRSSFAQNKPYDRLVHEVLSADGIDPKTKSAAQFFLVRKGEPHQITQDVSRFFLGMNLTCAQCHDHPLVNSYYQQHYYGVYAFFSRSYLFTDRRKRQTVYAEKAVGQVSFESVFKPKVKKQTGPRLPGMPPITEPKFNKGQEYKVKPARNRRGIPKFIRRSQLPGLLANDKNIRFKRAAANRFWAMMMGRGLVEPVDFDHPDNPPSHPKLLDLLAEEFAQRKFDVKFLLRELALSKTYQRSSQMPNGKKLPPENRFALAQLRPLSPEQMAWSMMQATGQIESTRKALGKRGNEATIHARLARNVAPFIKTFGGQAGDPADLGFQATLDQTLFLRNGAVVRNWLTPRTGSLTNRLLRAKNDKALADELFLSVFTRYPTREEVADVTKFLNENKKNRTAALQELSWALLASAEFRFNH